MPKSKQMRKSAFKRRRRSVSGEKLMKQRDERDFEVLKSDGKLTIEQIKREGESCWKKMRKSSARLTRRSERRRKPDKERKKRDWPRLENKKTQLG